MVFPIELESQVFSHNGYFSRKLVLHRGLTVLLGPNGSGKTHLLRGLKTSLAAHANGKLVRFLSAGRMGLLEQYRSDYNGHHGGNPNYEEAVFGQKRDVARRHQMEVLNGDFHTLAVRADILVKIQERLRKLFKRDISIDWDGGNLKISFARLESSDKPYSSGREASGLMHLVGILAALYDDEVGALLIDEPEVSLHPQLQAFLLKEILSVAGLPSGGGCKKLVVIATHSTEMLQIACPEDLLSLVFCYDLQNEPVQIAPDAGELKNRKVQGLIARLGQEHKLSLFSKRPLLVEGPSDVIICSAIAGKMEMHLEAAGSQLLPVIGKGQMPTVAKLLRLLGKDPVALADADGIADGLELVNAFLANNLVADRLASAAGFPSALQMASGIYSDFCKLVENRWSDISEIAETHPYWCNKNDDEIVQAKRRAALSALFAQSDEDIVGLAADAAWHSIKARFSALFNLLEATGLFILRKGSIESYYLSSDRHTTIGKPSAAVDEIDGFGGISQSDLDVAYNDVLRCIRYASNTEAISEAEALRDLLLSVVAPAHARFRAGDSAMDLNVLARTILGERAKIFDLTVGEGELLVTLRSGILNIPGFPLRLGKGDDVSRVVSDALST